MNEFITANFITIVENCRNVHRFDEIRWEQRAVLLPHKAKWCNVGKMQQVWLT